MKEIELDLVNYKQARALKKLGFPQDDRNLYYYRYDEKEILYKFYYATYDAFWVEYHKKGDDYHPLCTDNIFDISYNRRPRSVAPPLELAAKWLREEKNIDIVISVESNGLEYPRLYTPQIINRNVLDGPNSRIEFLGTFDSYEKALSASIDRIINLLNPPKEYNKKYTAFTEAEKHCIEIDCPYFVECDFGYGTCHYCKLKGQSKTIEENWESECY